MKRQDLAGCAAFSWPLIALQGFIASPRQGYRHIRLRPWLMYRPLKRSDPHSQASKKQQDDEEKNDHARAATRIITPAAAVRPSWQRAHGH
jgi:hypothetical protein